MGPINLLSIVSPEHEFRVADGRYLKNVQDLVVALAMMDDEVFSHHVNEERNDFASWIQFVYHDHKLAQKMEFTQEKKKMITILSKALQPKKEKKKRPIKTSKTKVVKKKMRKAPLKKQTQPKKREVVQEPVEEAESPVQELLKEEIIPELPSLSQKTPRTTQKRKPRTVQKKSLSLLKQNVKGEKPDIMIHQEGPALVMQTKMPQLVDKKGQPQVVSQESDDLFSMDPILKRMDKMTQTVESIEKEHDSIVQKYLKDLDKIPKDIKEELKQEKTKKKTKKKAVPKTPKEVPDEELAAPIRKPKVKAPEVKIIHPPKKELPKPEELPESLPDLEEEPKPIKIKVKRQSAVQKIEEPKVKEAKKAPKKSRRSFFKLKKKKLPEERPVPIIEEKIEPPKELERSVFKLKVSKPKVEEPVPEKTEIKEQVMKALDEKPDIPIIDQDEEPKEAPIEQEKAEEKPKGFFARMLRKRGKSSKRTASPPPKQKRALFKKDKLIKAEHKESITAQIQLPGEVDRNEDASGWDCKRMINNILRIEDVSIHYGKNIILQDISFIVNKGDMVAIVGGSGVGKTSLLNALIGHTPLMHGSISYYFAKEKRLIPVTGKSLPFKHKFGFAAQFPSIYPELTVQENLKYFAGLYDLPPPVKKENIENALRLVGLLGDENKPAKKLSGGMKKRLDIACSIVHKPEILILDEPTADVDPLLRNQIWNVLEDINNTGTTIVVASHHLTEVESMCNKVLFLREKSMEYYGDPAGFREKYATTREVEVTLDEEEYDEAVKKLTGMSFLEIKEQYRKKGKIILHSRKSEKIINRALLKALGKSSSIKIHDPSMDMLFKVFAEK